MSEGRRFDFGLGSGVLAVIKNWRAWVLLLLLVGPFLAYIGFGTIWLYERKWLWTAGSLWVASGIGFAVLAARWTKATTPLLPPLDWDAPHTFTAFDRKAWEIVESEADQGDLIALEALSEIDIYIETSRRLARKLAVHYHPLAADPIGHVPIVEFLTAMELAAEDLNRLCHQVPGGDLLTAAHWKQAVQVAGYVQKANDIYSYLLPIFSPITGLARLGTQQWMVKPAWKNMQQNLLRWFYRAFVNRLGMHLIELYSGRLAIGTGQYRRLTRKSVRSAQPVDGELATLVVAVAGARGAGKTRLIESLKLARGGDLSLLKARLVAAGLDEALIERLQTAQLVELPGYTTNPGGESARDRATRREAVEQAVEADLMILVIDGRRDTHAADVAFAQAWDLWYVEHPRLEIAPAMAVVTMVDKPEFGGEWAPPYNWATGHRSRELAVRARLEAIRAALPPTINEVVAVGLPEASEYGIAELLLPALASLFQRAERTALIRHLHRVSTRSKASRLVSQVGQQGRSLWESLRAARGKRKTGATTPPQG
ncbi:putative GTPase [Singulisphaera acidiphila DSM 18658]|uniref:Putative GTPase n=1 Tax=Singulisphaera acidiphila (strain ATCC BAA-1392 / DSM 18658 / VKM B-2454 / MOB10) TaxID=886293 RepID=L0D9A7_SINAD|nr:putative GTPase [Singulisphaera acidiphila DSM 18658]